jgi:hypothetical protein
MICDYCGKKITEEGGKKEHYQHCSYYGLVSDISSTMPEPKSKVRITGISLYALTIEAEKPGFIKFLLREVGNPKFPVDCEERDENYITFPNGAMVRRRLFTMGKTMNIIIDKAK